MQALNGVPVLKGGPFRGGRPASAEDGRALRLDNQSLQNLSAQQILMASGNSNILGTMATAPKVVSLKGISIHQVVMLSIVLHVFLLQPEMRYLALMWATKRTERRQMESEMR